MGPPNTELSHARPGTGREKKIQGENEKPWNMARTGFQFQIDSFG